MGQVVMIFLTMIFGATFLGVKAIEYTDKYNHGHIPVDGWNKVIPIGEGEEHAAAILPFEVKASAAEEASTSEEGKAKVHPNPYGEFQIERNGSR